MGSIGWVGEHWVGGVALGGWRGWVGAEGCGGEAGREQGGGAGLGGSMWGGAGREHGGAGLGGGRAGMGGGVICLTTVFLYSTPSVDTLQNCNILSEKQLRGSCADIVCITNSCDELISF